MKMLTEANFKIAFKYHKVNHLSLIWRTPNVGFVAKFPNVLPVGADLSAIARRPAEDLWQITLSHPGIVTLYEFGHVDGLFYLLIQFATSFTNLRSAIETVTLILEEDGSCKLIGYYVK
jgi:hypothetical protein